jgi:hypothetical protein
VALDEANTRGEEMVPLVGSKVYAEMVSLGESM